MFRVTIYAKSVEVKSERITQYKPRRHERRVVIFEFQEIIFQT